jgi:hypothetical protein
VLAQPAAPTTERGNTDLGHSSVPDDLAGLFLEDDRDAEFVIAALPDKA